MRAEFRIPATGNDQLAAIAAFLFHDATLFDRVKAN
jgi:hypothetical protein